MDNKIEMLESRACEIRKLTIQTIGKLGVGHIGGALSLCEVLSALYFEVMNIDSNDSKMENRDRLVLSKGHGGPALYSALALKGFIPMEELDTLNKPNTNLPSHCDMKRTNGIDMSTGSLGQGFSASTGMAVAAKMDKKSLYVYSIIGDGESQEGQIWEAAMLAGSRGLDNIIAFTDYNKMQIDGLIEEVNGLEPLDRKWEAFGWHVQTIDGHDLKQILYAIDNAKKIKGKPHMIILNTIKGKGGFFCENSVASHNMPISDDTWKKAVELLDKREDA
ncbi:Transketolase domain-containing protein [Ruminiclostridium papyrosolvens DSM 2782]|uniref:Transketolase domain-containing protein n=1 Tax=Ruminiclostridium papyrosolvens DSM 2782 TaxID=588581 RepID=F1T824_9FIRM|nr:transketolase [Ruminiclostridium papyrosolvens]EGD49622.1 Transketolase domain-containing protein [Ruminiclostridium papyrosolvens DSM 2782]WES33246.1 transketolase [Ruminiclostridium papyrosolvens DSM 2782]